MEFEVIVRRVQRFRESKRSCKSSNYIVPDSRRMLHFLFYLFSLSNLFLILLYIDCR
uniref:Uncharacterized protein n=1 Tax=Lepeophtheirus salmonis TaxID=72036 RepID=A0A0K2V722_LEPSM